jgi:hypothetical protein
MIGKMKKQIKKSEKYRKKIKLFFAEDWVLLTIAIIAMLYSLVNYLSNNSFAIFSIDREISVYFGIIFLIIFIIKFFFISEKIKSRLIYEVIDEKKFYSLILYNKTTVSLDKTLVPLYKEKADYFLNYLFTPNGTINLTPAKSERYIVEIDNKKYYFLPFLFEEKVLI